MGECGYQAHGVRGCTSTCQAQAPGRPEDQPCWAGASRRHSSRPPSIPFRPAPPLTKRSRCLAGTLAAASAPNQAPNQDDLDVLYSEIVQSMTELLLRGLATASVDSTTGDIFKSAFSVAVGMKTDLEGYLFQRTETLVRESVDGAEDYSDQLLKASTRPLEFLSDLIDDFVALKRNLLSHVSGFLSSESRLNKIKEFAQKLEMENIWPLDERKATAENILESIDLKCIYHCPERFAEQDELVEHRSRCKFRLVNCTNDGCLASFSAIHVEEHDSICPFKLLQCEQLCEQHVMRCEMDKHCETICPMKIINCPFHHVGCERAFPQGTLDRHCSDLHQMHLLYILQAITRQGAFVNDMNQRLLLLEKAQSLNELSGALDVRSLTLIIKEQEAKIKKLECDIKMQDAKMKKLENELRSRENAKMKMLENELKSRENMIT